MNNSTLTPRQALIVRLAVGLVFGLALGWLIKAMTPHYPQHPAQWVQICTSVLLLGAFIIWAGAGAMRRVTLAVWSAVALALIAYFAWNRICHALVFDDNPFFFNLYFLVYPFLFIAHELVSSGDQTGKGIASYPLYFDQAWKHGVQLALAVVFTGLFWGILMLGALLLGFIGFDWFKKLIENAYFAFPVSGMALAASVQLGDIQTKLTQNFRALVLGLLSWLLPVITVIGIIFAVSLCFSGLAPLWDTKAATASLLGGCVALVLLINAAYQQGDEERDIHIVIKWAVRIACGLLLIFAALAAFSLYLRVAQYGLTPERVLAGVGCLIAVSYGIGYPVAAVVTGGRWMRLVETVNIAMAFVMVVVFLAVLTPVADPLRLSADSQAARAASGKIAADAFDWDVLRYGTGTYGKAHLTDLAKNGKTDAIRKAAAAAALMPDDRRWSVRSERWDLDDAAMPDGKIAPKAPVKPDPKWIHMVQPGAVVPASFLGQANVPESDTSACLTGAAKVCYAALIDFNDDGQVEFLLLDDHLLARYVEGSDHAWTLRPNHRVFLDNTAVAAFKANKLSTRKPEPQWNYLKIGDDVEKMN